MKTTCKQPVVSNRSVMFWPRNGHFCLSIQNFEKQIPNKDVNVPNKMIAITFSNGQVIDRLPGWTELLPEAKEVCLLGLSLQANSLRCISVLVKKYRIVVVGWRCVYRIEQT